jgi:hypothetical protein
MPIFFYDIGVLALFISISIAYINSIAVILSRHVQYDAVSFVSTGIVGVLFYGLRGPGAPDMDKYLYVFKNLGSYGEFPWSYSMYWLMSGVRFFGESDQLLIMSLSLVLIVMLAASVWVLVKPPYRTFCLCLFLMSWNFFDLAVNVIRQGLAAGAGLLFLAAFQRGWKILASVLFAIALGFHWSFPVFALAVLVVRYARGHPKVITATILCIVGTLATAIFVELNLVQGVMSSTPIFSWLSVLTGIDVNYKMVAYLESSLFGFESRFYNYPVAARTYFILELMLGLLLALLAVARFRKGRLVFFSFANPGTGACDRLMDVIPLYAFLAAYSVVLIAMPYFYRNIYWTSVLFPFVVVIFVRSMLRVQRVDNWIIVCSFWVFFLFFSIITLWRSNILRMSY